MKFKEPGGAMAASGDSGAGVPDSSGVAFGLAESEADVGSPHPAAPVDAGRGDRESDVGAVSCSDARGSFRRGLGQPSSDEPGPLEVLFADLAAARAVLAEHSLVAVAERLGARVDHLGTGARRRGPRRDRRAGPVMLRMPAHSVGVAGLVGLGVLWAIPLTLIAVRIRRVWRRWSTPLPVLVPPLKQQQTCEAAQLRRSFPRCLPDPSPVPRTKRLENTNR